jgi:WD40 repeat protein
VEKISPTTARTRLDRVPLTVADRALLDTLLHELSDQIELSVEQAHELLFPGRTLAAATKAVERLVKKVNAAAEDEGVDLRLEVSGGKKLGARGRVLGFTAQRVDQPRDPLRERDAIGDSLITDRHATLIGPRHIVLCHAPQDAELAGQLWNLLTDALGCGQAQITVWRPDNDVLAGDDRDRHFRAAAAQADLAIVALSNAWLGQTAAHEILLSGTGLKVVPVRLQALSPFADAAAFGATPYPHDADGKPFEALRGAAAKRAWANGLGQQVQRLLTRHVSSPPDMGLRDLRLLKTDSRDGYFALEAAPGTMEPKVVPGAYSDTRRVNDVVSFLLNWAQDQDSTPLAALLGEYGAGKTITCQELTERLRDGDRPEPLYFDLRRVGNLSNGVPTLTEILTECIRRGWESADARLPTGEEVIARARTKPTLFVIDGLDEVLVRLDAAQGVAFTHELLKLRPIRTRNGISAPFAGKDTKVLLSCRTHYFRSLREQSRHFLEHDRDLTRAEDYTALILLPLTDKQIHDYLDKTLDRDATQVMDMLRAVHDLSDLATRPYTLAKVAAQVPFIERRLAEQRSVHAATIYQQVLRDWLARDSGKHRLRPDHKLKLMARLAAWSWRRGDRRVDSTDLDDWLDEQLATDEILRRRYENTSRDQLEEDLRTATFVIRSDENGPDRPDFQFAHSSIHEYFLAQQLCDALRDDRRSDWRLPMPSDETLDFLGQLIADADDQPVLTARLAEWRGPYVAEASELWLRYALRARDRGWPHSTIAACDLTGASLRYWTFRGTPTSPLSLAAATLSGADLRDTQWDRVTLSGANLSDARLDRATLHRTNLGSANLHATDLTGAHLRDCRTDGADLSDARTLGLRHFRSGTALPAPPQPARTRLHSPAGPKRANAGVTFSPDGARLAVAGHFRAHVCDATTGEFEFTFTGHTDWLSWVSFSRDGSLLATASKDRTARVWSAVTGEHLQTLTGHTDEVKAVVFDPDGSRLATCSRDGTAAIWDTTTGKRLLTFTGHTDEIWGVDLSSDGSRLATTSRDQTVRIWDAATGAHLLTLTGHTDAACRVHFSPDGTRIASTSNDTTARIWDATTGAHLLTLTGHRDPVWGGAFSPDGLRFATASNDFTARIWHAETGEHLLTIADHTDEVYGVAFSPDGSQITTICSGDTAHVWDSGTGEHLLTVARYLDTAPAVAFSPDGSQLATSGGGVVRRWDAATGEHLSAFNEHTGVVGNVAFSPDGSRLASASEDQTARVWNTTTGQHLLTLAGHTGTVRGLAFSPDGSELATTSADQTARIWNTVTGEHLLTLDHSAEVAEWTKVTSAAFSADGTQLATATDDDDMCIWDRSTGELLRIFTGGRWTAAVIPDSTYVTRRTARVRETTTREVLLTFQNYSSHEWTVVHGARGNRLAAGDDTAHVRDNADKERLITLTGITDEVRTATFSKDGTRLATACEDGTVRIWDLATNQLIWMAAHFPGDAAASWSPAEDRLITATGDVWRYLRAACFDEQGRMLGLQSYERYYSLPQSE